MSLSAIRTYHDPLHGAISLDPADSTEALLTHLIDTPPFQRLRRIRQMGPANLTFHGAECSRFTHSLGVMEVSRRAFDGIAKVYPQLKPYRPVVLCSALLHDIGHGPFSHTAEDIFGSQHEYWTCRILTESHPIYQRLTAFDESLVANIIQVYQHCHPIPFVWQLVSSQLDCDRLDYLMRDSHFTGATYGQLDLDRILMAMDYDPVSQQLIVAYKGLAAIEHYLIVRHFMHTQVYNHPKNIAATWVLEQAFQRARELLKQGTLDADETVKNWLTYPPPQISLKHYLAADDIVLTYHLQQWQSHPDQTLSDLCRRFLDRDLLKALDITTLKPDQQDALLQAAAHYLDLDGFIPRYYLGIRTSVSRGYTLYQRGIKLRTSTGLQQISDLSPLVQTLIHPHQRAWLIYPKRSETNLFRAFDQFQTRA